MVRTRKILVPVRLELGVTRGTLARRVGFLHSARMSWQSAWVIIALGAWLAAACGSRSGLGLGQRLGEADPEEVGLAGAANGAGAELDSVNGGGAIQGGGGMEPTGPTTDGIVVPDPPAVTLPPPAPEWFPRGVLPLRSDELRRSARALLGVAIQTDPRADFEQEHSYELSPQERVWSAVSDDWLDQVLSQVTDEQLQAAVGCDADFACSPDALMQFAARAWRKPLDDAEFEEVLAAFELAQQSGTGGARRFVRKILGDPDFALLSLMGEQVGGGYQLTDFELASWLSFHLTGGPPDAELWNAAASGELRKRDARVAQATRLLQTPQGQTYIGAWVAHWFGAVAYENTGHPLGAEMLNGETRRLLQDVLFEAQLPLQRLRDADYTCGNRELAEWYGLPNVGEGWRKVSLADTARRGILHHASWLSQGLFLESNHFPLDEIHAWRGSLPFKLVCRALPPPPPAGDVPLELEVLEGTPREQLEAHTKDPVCAGCHTLFNPMSFSFDHYDGAGQYKETYSNGQPIDASGEVTLDNSEHFEFDDGTDFVTQLATSDAYLDCFWQTWVGGSAGLGSRDESLESYLRHNERPERFMDLVLQFVGSEHYVNRR